MASVATPLARRVPSILELSNRRKQHRQHAKGRGRQQEELWGQASGSAEETSRTRALAYLDDFLQKSPWQDLLHQISIIPERVPTMEELHSYGHLNEAEGTQACRRLFKAVVVWDHLGHSLWEKLSVAAEQRKAALEGLSPLMTDPAYEAASLAVTSGRSSTRGSKDSAVFTTSRQSSRSPPLIPEKHPAGKTYQILGSVRSASVPPRPSRARSESYSISSEARKPPDPETSDIGKHVEGEERRDAKAAIPRKISQNFPAAVRKRFGGFGDARCTSRGPGSNGQWTEP